jgi:hypothetical protein
MRTVLAALVSLFVLSGTSALAAPTASGALPQVDGHATARSSVDGDDDEDDDEDDDDDDDDEEFRAIG